MATLIAWSLPADARQGGISISARSLPKALAELSREAGVSIGSEGSLPRLRTPRIASAATVAEALARLLAGTGLEARQVGPSAWRIERLARARSGQGSRDSAAADEPQETTSTEPIVVTATKRSQVLAAAPVAVSVVQLGDGEDADPQRDSGWVARRTDGVTLAGQGPGRNRMFLRGVADSPFNGDSQSTVAVILDDSRLTYSAPDPDIRLVDVDRVEVLKGPQGALYGTGALGGIYRIVTRRPDPSAVAAETAVQTEVLSAGQLGVSGSAMANLPLIQDAAALRVVAYGAKSPGWVDTGGDVDNNSGTAVGVRVGLGMDPGGGWRIDASGFGQWLNAADSSYVYASGARSRPGQLDEPHDNDLRHVSLSARHESAIDLTLASGMTWHEVRDRSDATQGAGGFGLADPETLDEDRQYRTWDSELRLAGAAGSIDWLAGLSHVEARQATAANLTSRSGGELTLQTDRRIVSDSAVFGEATLALSSALDLLAGGRVFRTHLQDRREAGVAAFEASRTKVGATPAVALSWRSGPRTLLYLRYGSAFRQGGSGLGESGRIETLAGDELATLEAGWRQSIGEARLDVGAYVSRWENVQSDMLGADGLLTTRNAGDARVLGAEASFAGPIGSGLFLDAGATWQSALLVRNETGLELDDRRLPVIPEYTLRATLSRKWSLESAATELALSLRYVGRARLSFQPELDLPMGNYLESSLEGQVRFDGLRVGLKVDNLFGSHTDTLPYGNPLRISSMRQYTPQRPRAVSLGIDWSM